MGLPIKNGVNADEASVNSDKELAITLTKDITKPGLIIAVGQPDDGSISGTPLNRQLDISNDFRLRVGLDSILWDDTFNHGQFNVSKYSGVTSTMTITLAAGFLNLNAGSALASGNVCRVQTYRTFPMLATNGIYFDIWLSLTAARQTNSIHEFGLGIATATTTPTDGVFFRISGTQLLGVINNNSTEQSVILTFDPGINEIHHYLIVVHQDRVEFWINDVLYGTLIVPIGQGSPSLSPALPLLLRQYNTGVVSSAIITKISKISVYQADLNNNRLWATAMVGNGQSSLSTPDGIASAQLANYANSAAPASATLSNTAAGYTTLGGQWQFAAVAGSETDYALFAYQVPAVSPTQPGKTLMIRGIRIEAFNTVVAVATTATVMQWGIGIGSTAVSLATADSATAGTRAARRITLGTMYFPVASPVGQNVTPLDFNFDTPFMAEAGTFVHIILKMPIATATATEIFRGTCFINAYFE